MGDGEALPSAQLQSGPRSANKKKLPSHLGSAELVAFLTDQLADLGCDLKKFSSIRNPSEPNALWDFWGMLPHRASRADVANKKVLLKQLMSPISLAVPDEHHEALVFVQQCLRLFGRCFLFCK